ncbi:MAG: hypothetical protein N2036_08690 [Bryobacteraceae bacterium]|nr:hypothetical protein [Bryobacteraceae bacterium]MCX7604139.1 hypothetical protein [Bryobacteraceae bacterium]
MWRALILLTIAAGLQAQQQESRTYVYDANGRRVEWSATARGQGFQSETIRDINGRQVPVERTEERVLRKEAGLQVVERLVKRYTPDGSPLPPEKVVIETRTRPDGSTEETALIYRGDLNGNLRPAERIRTETRKSGDTAVSETKVERAGLSGGFSLVEKRTATEVVRASDRSSEREELVYVPDTNGRLVAAQKKVVRSRERDGTLEQQTDEYEAATTGALRLSRQLMSVTRRNPDGTENTVVDVYGVNAPGRAIEPGAGPRLRERQIYTSRQSPDGSVVTVFAVQRPSLNSTRELGPPERVSETVTRIQN